MRGEVMKIKKVKSAIRAMVNNLNKNGMVVMVCPELMRVVYGATNDEGKVCRRIVQFRYWEDIRDYIRDNGHMFGSFTLAPVKEKEHADK